MRITRVEAIPISVPYARPIVVSRDANYQELLLRRECFALKHLWFWEKAKKLAVTKVIAPASFF